MPRQIPKLDRQLSQQVAASVALVRRLESIAAMNSRLVQTNIRRDELELAYELAYLRVFMAWEILLEEAFYRYMCGYYNSSGQEALNSGNSYYRKIKDAELSILQGRQYILWHNVDSVISRAARFFDNSRYERILASAQQRLVYFSAIRHRIAHAQQDAANKFDRASMNLAGRRYAASRPGRFLRDWKAGSNPPTRWLETICAELESLGKQICD